MAIVAGFTIRGTEALFRADALGLAAAAALAGFSGGGLRVAAARVAAASVGVAVGHLLVGWLRAGEAGHPLALLALAAGVGVAAGGLSLAGRAARCPASAAGAVATAVLWTACAGLWWADDLAEAVPREKRFAVREAVLRADPFTAAAYGAASYDRLHAPEVYDQTTVASLSMRPPAILETAALWAGLGAVAAACAAAASRLRSVPS